MLKACLIHASLKQFFLIKISWRTGEYNTRTQPINLQQIEKHKFIYDYNLIQLNLIQYIQIIQNQKIFIIYGQACIGFRVLVKQKLTKSIILNWSGRMHSHIGFGTSPTIEGIAAVGNLGQCANARSSNALEVRTVQEIVKSLQYLQKALLDQQYYKSSDQLRASSRGNTRGASVIRTDWAQRVRRLLIKFKIKFWSSTPQKFFNTNQLEQLGGQQDSQCRDKIQQYQGYKPAEATIHFLLTLRYKSMGSKEDQRPSQSIL
eukprot:TRINITY_DN640_c6_g1_i1.p1 TRINITY_DN640_c6_g1~~TRINITY_DN640_c6_g1_i1.p1  ORF type:complete len:261 (-),score=-6.32 TRINITY_DN640_c6_g1_i1:192-974(-)